MKIDIELHTGRMTFEELTEWKTHIRKSELTDIVEIAKLEKAANNLRRKFKGGFDKELSKYCEFERYKENGKYAGVNITKILDEKNKIYVKSTEIKKLGDFIITHVSENEKHNYAPTSGTWVAEKYLQVNPNCGLTYGTIEHYSRKILKEYYGDGIKVKEGTKGISKCIPCISVEKEPIKLTSWQLERRRELFKEYVTDPMAASMENCTAEAKDRIMDSATDIINFGESRKVKKKLQRLVAKETGFDIEVAFRNWGEACKKEFGGWPISGRPCKNGYEPFPIETCEVKEGNPPFEDA